MRELEFKAQLAHDGSVTKKISDFANVKELYQRLAEAFNVQKSEVSSQKKRDILPMLLEVNCDNFARDAAAFFIFFFFLAKKFVLLWLHKYIGSECKRMQKLGLDLARQES